MPKTNANLHQAKKEKNDEFYTQISDIEKELIHYKQYFRNKIIYCNCDNPEWSNFWRYFHLNFSELGLKKLISTHYDTKNPVYKKEYVGGNDADITVGTITILNGNGDYNSKECINVLKEADLIVTNPPFSLFRQYVLTLIEYEKDFIIIGNNNAITYKEIFPYIQAGKVNLGYNSNISMVFRMSNDYEPRGNSWIDENGDKYAKIQSCTWYTTLDIDKKHEMLKLKKTYTPEEYPTYINYNGINVDRVADIPMDFEGVMGVPITFMDKYCPEQFEIVGFDQTSRIPIQNCGLPKGTYTPSGSRLYIKEREDWYKMCYARILIRKRVN